MVEWRSLTPDELARRRRHIDKGNKRVITPAETRAAPHQIDTNQDGQPFINVDPLPTKPADPRKVAESLLDDIARQIRESPQSRAVMRIILRRNPMFQGLSDDEIDRKLEDWADTESQRITREVYHREGWDRGTNLDVQEKGVWLPSPASPPTS